MTEAFPVLEDMYPKRYVGMDMLDEVWAKKIHYQTLERLRERGGLSPKEIYANVYKIPYSEFESIDYLKAFDLVEELRIFIMEK